MLLPTTFSASRKCVIPILLRRGISQHTSPGRFVRKARTQVQFLPKTSVRSNSSFKSGGSDKFSPRNAEEAEAHLKISRPGYYKLLKEARAVDDLPKSWDLIFHGKKSRKYIIFGHWAFLFTVIITPIVTAYVVWENQYEEDVIIAGWIISKSVEMALFVIMQGLILYSFFRPYSHMPLRIYFNSTEDKYMAIFISKLAPWKTTRMEFRATDVSAHKTNLMMLRKDCEYRVRQKPMTFPPLYFRSGDDEFRLLRFKDLPDHQRH